MYHKCLTIIYCLSENKLRIREILSIEYLNGILTKNLWTLSSLGVTQIILTDPTSNPLNKMSVL